MNWVPHVDYVEAEPFEKRATKKKYWNNDKKEWCNHTIWTVAYSKKMESWLENNFGPPSKVDPGVEGRWGRIFDKIIIDEKIYLFYCLKFKGTT